MYRNARQALVGELKHLFEHGKQRPSRNGDTLEVLGREIVIEHPEERFLLLHERNDNPIAKIAETMWVLGGRDDLHYLGHYLPRAREYSDDGYTWRAAYGPRLRRWYRYGTESVDQVAECVKLLRADPSTRRAVMTIYDPSVDYCDSKDIPCNNWIQWLLRDDKLHMFVTVRSNDVMWGFSGINAFEWSVLHAYMANWLDVEVGAYHQYTGSLHLYEKHFERAQRMLQAYNGYEPYDNPIMVYPDPAVPFNQFESALSRWFWIELKSRSTGNKVALDDARDCLELAMALPDLYLRETAYAVIAYNIIPYSISTAYAALSLMPLSAMSLNVWEYLLRTYSQFAAEYSVRAPEELAYLAQPAAAKPVDFIAVANALHLLEYKKTLRYKDSWRKHGEVLSIFANISRKYDRIEHMLTDNIPGTSDEGLVDDWGDLAVYCLKYAGYLGETYGITGLPISFETALLTLQQFQDGQHYANVVAPYKLLEQLLTSDNAYKYDPKKYIYTMRMAQLCVDCIVHYANDNPQAVQKWLASIEAL